LAAVHLSSRQLFLQWMFGDVAAGGNYPISTPHGEWKSLVIEARADRDPGRCEPEHRDWVTVHRP
jgi:hypothetical protein